jgi:diaminopimelate epimerase
MNERDSKKYINMLKTNENKAKKILKELMSSIITKEKAIGIMLIEKEKKDIKINPVVWVKTVDTLYYETACGSGSLAYAIYNYTQNRGKNVDLIQPSGYKISVNIFGNKKTIQSVKISGIVI